MYLHEIHNKNPFKELEKKTKLPVTIPVAI